MYAAGKGHAEVVNLLLSRHGIDINAQDFVKKSALMYAARKISPETLRLLLYCDGINFNAKDEDGMTALINAAYCKRPENVRLLLNCDGVDIHAQDNKQRTALWWAVSENNLQSVRLLLDYPGHDMELVDVDGMSVASLARERGIPEIIELIENYKTQQSFTESRIRSDEPEADKNGNDDDEGHLVGVELDLAMKDDLPGGGIGK
ncbi:ankyrin repeat-containing domain protein [Peziza echinospora]|nr:ankyrin repeat-containing domain protein [Peziza echinospora]